MRALASTHVDVSVCICTYNRAAQLQRAMESLFAQQTDELFAYEIVVVDDGSTDDTCETVQQAMGRSPVPLRYCRQVNRGVAAARNRTVAEAAGAWLAFFDDDELASPSWLTTLWRTALSTGAECVGGPCLLSLPEGSGVAPTGTVRKLLGENPFMTRSESSLGFLDPRRLTTAIPGTGNALVKRSAISRVGGFREDLRYGEDAAFFRHAKRIGIKLAVAPTAVVHQIVPIERLQPRYLFSLAEKGACAQADEDWREGNWTRLSMTTLLRCLHAAAWTLPSIGLTYSFGQHGAYLSSRCSMRFARCYLERLLHHLTGRSAIAMGQ